MSPERLPTSAVVNVVAPMDVISVVPVASIVPDASANRPVPALMMIVKLNAPLEPMTSNSGPVPLTIPDRLSPFEATKLIVPVMPLTLPAATPVRSNS